MTPYDGYGWIKVKRYNPPEDATVEEKLRLLEEHHEREVNFLIRKIRELGKAEAVLQRIVDLSNEGKKVYFEADFGGNTLTVAVGDLHSHCGVPKGTLELLINNLYNLLIEGSHLSWEEGNG